MRTHFAGPLIVLATALLFEPFLSAQNGVQSASTSSPTASQPFDPHDLSGDWIGESGPRNSRWANKTPEPALTEWAKQHLLYKSISHDALDGTLRDPNNPPNNKIRDNDRAFYATDLYGVPVNDPLGEYPGKDCVPEAAPAMYDTPHFSLLTFFITPEQIVMLNGHHREWRIFWLNRGHPNNIRPTFEGDSTARWEGDTLVVDTIGFNGKTMITGVVAHSKSDAFHLVERFRRVDHDNLVIEMTFYDPKAWSDKSWSGFKRYFHRVPIEQVHDRNYKVDEFTEWACSPADNKNFDKRVMDLYKKP